MMKIRFHWLTVLLLLFLIYLQYHLWFASGGVLTVRQLKQQIVGLKAENKVLKQNNTALWFQIHRLKNNQDATEEKARNELGMIKKGETFYQYVRDKG